MEFEGGIDYLHSYHSSRPRVAWNRCGQAAVATVLDYHGLNPFGLKKPLYDTKDGRYHWDDGQIIDRITENFPPDNLFGLFGTSAGQLVRALTSAGLEAGAASSPETDKGQTIWEEVKRSVGAGLPVIVIMDRRKLGGLRPFAAHWGVVYKVANSTVYLANTKNISRVAEARFMRAFHCRFMPAQFNHCAVFSWRSQRRGS